MTVKEKVLVQAADNMTDVQFAKHMQMRHPDSIGYMRSFSMTIGRPYLMRLWRLFHGQLHNFRIDLKHEHGDP